MGSNTEVLDLPPERSRLVVLGDPHGALEAVRTTLELEADDRTQALCVGDVVGYADGPRSSVLAEFLQDQQIPTVEGNHEDWVRPDGALSIVLPGATSLKLSDRARGWVSSLPEFLEIRTGSPSRRAALMAHSIRNPRWDWLNARNVSPFVESYGTPDFLLTGHSHRPKFFLGHRDRPVEMIPFDFRVDDEISISLPDRGWLVVDAGSMGRPELEPCLLRGRPRERFPGYGTYALVDLEARTASLKVLRSQSE